MIEENKIMNLSDGKVLYDDLRDRIEERGLPENGQLGQIPMKKNNGVRWADIPVDTSKADKVTGATNGNFAALDSNGNLIDSGHKHSDYLTEHQTIPVTDVRTETGTSLVNNNVAVIPRAHSTNEGTVKVTEDGALNAYYGVLSLRTADSTQIKAGTEALKPIVPYRQHESAFYGLAKAAGDTAQAQSENGVGAYTDAAKTKIQNMLNVPSANTIASLETNSTATKNYSIGDLFTMDGKLYKVTAAITQNGAIVTEGNGQNCEEVSVASEFARNSDIPTVPVQDVQVNGISILSNGVANVPLASDDTLGVAKVGSGLAVVNNAIVPNFIGDSNIKKGTVSSGVIASSKQHIATFYGLAKAAGDSTQASSSNSVGTYTDNAKTAIRNMIGAAAQSDIPSVPVQDVQVNGASILNNGIANVPVASASAPGVVMVDQAYGIIIHPTLGYLAVNQATDNDIKAGTVGQKPIVPYTQHASTFYGLAKAAGDNTQSASDNAVGTYTNSAKSAIRSMIGAASSNDIPSVPVQDVQVNGTSILSNGVANVPLASHNSSSSTPGVVKIGWYTGGLYLGGGELKINAGNLTTIKNYDTQGNNAYAPILYQRATVFYGLAQSAGDTTQSQSDNAIGNYTNEAKAAIQSMIGVENGVSFIETISDTDVTITGEPNTRYICGEVSTISITPPNAGIISVTFTSGTSVAILSLPNTVKLPAWFDKTNLETNTTYEIIITDGIYGSVMTWQS